MRFFVFLSNWGRSEKKLENCNSTQLGLYCWLIFCFKSWKLNHCGADNGYSIQQCFILFHFAFYGFSPFLPFKDSDEVGAFISSEFHFFDIIDSLWGLGWSHTRVRCSLTAGFFDLSAMSCAFFRFPLTDKSGSRSSFLDGAVHLTVGGEVL